MKNHGIERGLCRAGRARRAQFRDHHRDPRHGRAGIRQQLHARHLKRRGRWLVTAIVSRREEAFNRTMVGVSRARQGEQNPLVLLVSVEDFSFATAGRTTPDPAPTSVEAEKKPRHSAARS